MGADTGSVGLMIQMRPTIRAVDLGRLEEQIRVMTDQDRCGSDTSYMIYDKRNFIASQAGSASQRNREGPAAGEAGSDARGGQRGVTGMLSFSGFTP